MRAHFPKITFTLTTHALYTFKVNFLFKYFNIQTSKLT